MARGEKRENGIEGARKRDRERGRERERERDETERKRDWVA